MHLTVVEQEGRTTLRLEERMDASVALGTAFLGGFAGFLAGLFAIVLLRAMVDKALLVLLLGALTSTGAAVGWAGGRVLWRRRSESLEAQLQRDFAAIVALASARALPSPADE